MKHLWKEMEQSRKVAYLWKKGGVWNSIEIEAALEATKIKPNSITEFITEHYWGYAKVNDHVTNEYEVTHPKWEVYKMMDYKLKVDFGLVYGKTFNILNQQAPSSVMLAEGSVITVEPKRKIK
jgi:hypothetical protein